MMKLLDDYSLSWKKRCSFFLLMPLMLLLACMPTTSFEAAITIPTQSDWIDCGPIFNAGAESEWDYYLWGGFASTIIKKDGIFYLYYQGANGYNDDEGTVTWRSIGVATSNDGFHFTKFTQNPVLTWFPNDNLEEGAVSVGAFLDDSGEIAIYYGANNWIGGSKVNTDGRLATSTDGFAFTDQGIILNHNDSSVWGSGDELFPIIGFEDNGRYFTYYIPNGVLQRGKLGVAWGDQSDQLVNSAAVQAGLSPTSVWGPGSVVKVSSNTYALFLNNVYAANGSTIDVRITTHNAPASVSAPVQSYQFDNVWEAIVYLDDDTDTWFMYYRSVDHEYYGVKIASANGQIATCPTQQKLYFPFIERDSLVTPPINLCPGC